MAEGEVSIMRMVSRFAFRDRGLPAEESPLGVSVPPDTEVEYEVALKKVGPVMPDPGELMFLQTYGKEKVRASSKLENA
jgi:hypothetical protein